MTIPGTEMNAITFAYPDAASQATRTRPVAAHIDRGTIANIPTSAPTNRRN